MTGEPRLARAALHPYSWSAVLVPRPAGMLFGEVVDLVGIASVAEAFQEFSTWFRAEREEQGRVLDDLRNGFEGWLKVECYSWLVEKKKAIPNEDVGVEYNVRLDLRRGEQAKKRCDLWVRAEDHQRFHYVEFKAPFAEFNSGKMLQGAGFDFWHLMRMRAKYERAASGSAVVVGVGFDDATWNEARAVVRDAAGLDPEYPFALSGLLSARVRWDVWTHEFSA